MFLVYAASTVIFAMGAYFISADILRLPTFATTKAAINISRYTNSKVKKWEEILLDISSKAAKIIRIGDYRRQALARTLKAANISIPPETWLARCYVKFAFLLLCMVPCAFIVPILTPVIAVLAVRQLFTDLKSADMIVLKKKKEIEENLPRFAATISQELKNTRNVLAVLEGYRDCATPSFRRELIITIGDMKSGSQETALSRLDSRVGSSMLSEVILGLQGVLHGDDESRYFETLAHDFDQDEIQQMRLSNAKLPGKVSGCIGAVFLCFMLIVFLILGMQIHQSWIAFR